MIAIGVEPRLEEVEVRSDDKYTALYFQNDVIAGATVASFEQMDEELVQLIHSSASRNEVLRKV